MLSIEDIRRQMSSEEFQNVLSFGHHCMYCDCSSQFHDHILDFAAFLGFEFVLYGYTIGMYDGHEKARVINLSNPESWNKEYTKKYLPHDPVLQEVERKIARGDQVTSFIWDRYDWPLSALQQEVIDRRRHFGLEYGCSAYANSGKKDFAFLVSFASQNTRPDDRTKNILTFIVRHLMITAKRLFILDLVGTLTPMEGKVAAPLLKGKSNKQIALSLHISDNTVKFHLGNIYRKLEVKNRQQAIALLLAEHYLSI